jgi:hypothetical protein
MAAATHHHPTLGNLAIGQAAAHELAAILSASDLSDCPIARLPDCLWGGVGRRGC